MVTTVTCEDAFIDSRDLVAYMDMYEDELRESGDWPDFQNFRAEFEDYAQDFDYGSTAIADWQWVSYCQDLVVDCGYLPYDLPGFIEANINWEGVAADLAMDYTVIEFGSNKYYVM